MSDITIHSKLSEKSESQGDKSRGERVRHFAQYLNTISSDGNHPDYNTVTPTTPECPAWQMRTGTVKVTVRMLCEEERLKNIGEDLVNWIAQTSMNNGHGDRDRMQLKSKVEVGFVEKHPDGQYEVESTVVLEREYESFARRLKGIDQNSLSKRQ